MPKEISFKSKPYLFSGLSCFYRCGCNRWIVKNHFWRQALLDQSQNGCYHVVGLMCRNRVVWCGENKLNQIFLKIKCSYHSRRKSNVLGMQDFDFAQI